MIDSTPRCPAGCYTCMDTCKVLTMVPGARVRVIGCWDGRAGRACCWVDEMDEFVGREFFIDGRQLDPSGLINTVHLRTVEGTVLCNPKTRKWWLFDTAWLEVVLPGEMDKSVTSNLYAMLWDPIMALPDVPIGCVCTDCKAVRLLGRRTYKTVFASHHVGCTCWKCSTFTPRHNVTMVREPVERRAGPAGEVHYSGGPGFFGFHEDARKGLQPESYRSKHLVYAWRREIPWDPEGED